MFSAVSLSNRMLRPFNKLTCESENQGIKNLEAKITGLREKVQLREETASCTYISQTVIIRATFFILPQVNSMKCFKYLLTSATQVWYTSLTRPLFFIGLACARLQPDHLKYSGVTWVANKQFRQPGVVFQYSFVFTARLSGSNRLIRRPMVALLKALSQSMFNNW